LQYTRCERRMLSLQKIVAVLHINNKSRPCHKVLVASPAPSIWYPSFGDAHEIHMASCEQCCVQKRRAVVLTREASTALPHRTSSRYPPPKLVNPYITGISFIVMATLHPFNVFKTPLKVRRSQ